jgi:superfamily II DNA/RNA helicase
MLDIGFRDDIRNILSRVKGIRRSGEPADPQAGAEQGQHDGDEAASAHSGAAQTIFVSATISEEIDKLARQFMREPVEKLIAPGVDEKPMVDKVEQYYLAASGWDKYRLLRTLLEKENPDLAIVFTRTKRGAEKIAKRLHADGIACREIHGNLAQNKREHVMKGFRHGKFDVLIATDLASRGIDVADISHIINYDIPEDPEVYVHRVGRTARMGAAGKAFTLVEKHQGDELTKIENLINMEIPLAQVEGYEPRPQPSDWSDLPPGMAPDEPSKPIVNRFERRYAASTTSTEAPLTLPAPPRTIGSKIPINRRHKRRR